MYSSTSSTAIYVISSDRITETHSQFQVISSCLAKDFGEIWRIVERTTCTGGVAVSPIPESVIGVEYERWYTTTKYISRLTEVIFSNKWWDYIILTTNITWTDGTM